MSQLPTGTGKGTRIWYWKSLVNFDVWWRLQNANVMSKIVANEFLSISKSTIIHFARTQKHIQNETQQNNAINDKMKTTERCLKSRISERFVNNGEQRQTPCNIDAVHIAFQLLHITFTVMTTWLSPYLCSSIQYENLPYNHTKT